jgi:peptidoglycan/LPS O-acetylase OafA/YrhL
LNLLDQFSRITSPQRVFIPQIDGLRFMAVLAVLGYHVRAICSYHLLAVRHTVEGDPVNDALSVGHYGVSLFFVISGFILALPFARQYLSNGKKIDLRGYYLRRITRIEPPYVIHLILLGLYCWLVLRWQPSHPHLYHNKEWAAYAGTHLLASLFYMNGLIFATHPYPNIVLWSLEVEVQFYLIMPFLALLFKIANPWIRRSAIILLICVGPLVFGSIFGGGYRFVFSLLDNCSYFLVGFLLADLFLFKKVQGPLKWAWDLIFPLSAIAFVLLRNWSGLSMLAPWIIFACFFGAFRGVLTSRFLSFQVITVIGGMCYTIYLYHWLMISLLIRATIRLQTHILWLDLIVQFILMSIVIIGLCSVLFVFLERPFMRRDWPAEVNRTLSRLAARGWKSAHP